LLLSKQSLLSNTATSCDCMSILHGISSRLSCTATGRPSSSLWLSARRILPHILQTLHSKTITYLFQFQKRLRNNLTTRHRKASLTQTAVLCICYKIKATFYNTRGGAAAVGIGSVLSVHRQGEPPNWVQGKQDKDVFPTG
jgi:hypothetical protein